MILRKLIPGKAIGAQPYFVETFNALVDFVRNLKGDKDVNSSTGAVHLDRHDPARPVIRMKEGIEPDGVSLEKIGTNGKLQIAGWDYANPGAGMQLSSILMGDDEQNPQNPLDMADVPIREPNDGKLQYAGIGTIPTDGASIVREQDPDAAAPSHRLALAGFSSATVGQVPVKGANGIRWVDAPTSIDGNNKIVVIGVEWVGSGHADFSAHPYSIKIVRGTLEVSNGVLSATPDANLTRWIATTPLSAE